MLKFLANLIFVSELIVLALPVTVLAILAGLLVVMGDKSHPDYIPFLIAFVVGCGGLIGFRIVTVSFLFNDPDAIKKLPLWVWVPTSIGALMSATVVILAGVPILMHKPPIDVSARITPIMLVGAVGAPLLIPLIHMLIVAWRADSSFKPDSLRGLA